MSGRRNEDRVLEGKLEGKEPQERSRLRLEDNIERNFQEVGVTDLAQDRDRWRDIVNTAMNHRVP